VPRSAIRTRASAGASPPFRGISTVRLSSDGKPPSPCDGRGFSVRRSRRRRRPNRNQTPARCPLSFLFVVSSRGRDPSRPTRRRDDSASSAGRATDPRTKRPPPPARLVRPPDRTRRSRRRTRDDIARHPPKGNRSRRPRRSSHRIRSVLVSCHSPSHGAGTGEQGQSQETLDVGVCGETDGGEEELRDLRGILLEGLSAVGEYFEEVYGGVLRDE